VLEAQSLGGIRQVLGELPLVDLDADDLGLVVASN
jgi:hypothetical protein